MPIRLDTPVLTVDAGVMHKVDPRNVENLFGMWTGKYYFVTPLSIADSVMQCFQNVRNH